MPRIPLELEASFSHRIDEMRFPRFFVFQGRGSCYLFLSLLSVDPVFQELDGGGVTAGGVSRVPR